jgi:hypothetical protein
MARINTRKKNKDCVYEEVDEERMDGDSLYDMEDVYIQNTREKESSRVNTGTQERMEEK